MDEKKDCTAQGLTQGFPEMSTGRENVTGKRHSRDAQDPECHGYVHMFQGENDEIESSKLRKLCLLGIHTKQVLFCFVFTS